MKQKCRLPEGQARICIFCWALYQSTTVIKCTDCTEALLEYFTYFSLMTCCSLLRAHSRSVCLSRSWASFGWIIQPEIPHTRSRIEQESTTWNKVCGKVGWLKTSTNMWHQIRIKQCQHILRGCLHDTGTKCRTGTSHTGTSSLRFLYRYENFVPVWRLTTFRTGIT